MYEYELIYKICRQPGKEFMPETISVGLSIGKMVYHSNKMECFLNLIIGDQLVKPLSARKIIVSHWDGWLLLRLVARALCYTVSKY